MEMLELEMDTGLHAMETLLTEQMDKACELFMSWSYRNVFTVGAFGGVVLVGLPLRVMYNVQERKLTSATLLVCFLPSLLTEGSTFFAADTSLSSCQRESARWKPR
jgi:hypothetical protein